MSDGPQYLCGLYHISYPGGGSPFTVTSNLSQMTSSDVSHEPTIHLEYYVSTSLFSTVLLVLLIL